MTERRDPAIRVLEHRELPASWLARRLKGAISADSIRRVARGEREWSVVERPYIADVLDLPEDILWPQQIMSADAA